MSLVESLKEFLGAFKNAESMTAELRGALTVTTDLEQLLLSAVVGGRTVLITGAAGSGKTHLLSGLKAPKGVQLVGTDEKPKGKHILVIPDATELGVDERIKLLKSAPSTRIGTIVAINEGPLRETAQATGGDIYRAGADLLHRGQRGLADAYDSKRPTVIDMGAFDPIQQGVVADILALPLLREAVEDRPCGCPADLCPRVLTWKQLENPELRKRVARICTMILLADTEWSFRDIWDFAADLVLGGSCDDDPPSSSWFWRVLYGDSRISSTLRDVCDPESVAMPAVDQRLWYADWESTLLSLLPGVEFQLISKPDDLSNLDKFLWLRAQVLLGTSDQALHELLYLSLQHKLRGAAIDQQIAPIIEAINSYMTYDLLPPTSARLRLWIDHSVERRTDRTYGQVLAGWAEATDLAVRPSQVVINHPALTNPFFGGRRFLVHEKSSAVLELTQDKLTLLETRRSFRRADRRHTDLEFDLMRFFSRVLADHSSNEIGFLTCDFKRLVGEIHSYSVSMVANTIEERQ